MDHTDQVMVYNSTQEAYRQLMESLPALFESFGAEEEYLSEEHLREMERQCRDTFFCGEMIPPYEPQDVRNILKYYAQYETDPAFYTFEEIDRSRLDVAAIARKIWDERMTAQEETAYLNALWDSGDDNMLNLFFKSVRIRCLYGMGKEYVRIKLRTLLAVYGYRRRSRLLVFHILRCMDFYHLKATLRGGGDCDLTTCGLDQMLTFRVEQSLEDH